MMGVFSHCLVVDYYCKAAEPGVDIEGKPEGCHGVMLCGMTSILLGL